jgi:hypothetical protein
MINVSADDLKNVGRIVDGRRVDVVVQSALSDIEFKFDRSQHIDAHDKANLINILRYSLQILTETGKAQETFGEKLEKGLSDDDLLIVKVALSGLAKFLKVGGRI